MGEIVTLNQNRDFRRIYSRGRSYVSPIVVVYVLKNRSKNIRFGITTSKKTGNAVKRNRSRRIILAAFRKLIPNLKSGYDIVFVARAKTSSVKSTDILKQITCELKKSGILNDQ